MAKLDFIPKADERALIVGRTGYGKTQFAKWMLRRVYLPFVIIIDTKFDDTFRELPRATIATNEAEIDAAFHSGEYHYCIYRPDISLLVDFALIDRVLLHIYNHFNNSVVYIDELTQVTNSSRPGPGLKSLLSRGRSRHLETIMSTQRPVAIPRDCISESERFYIFQLTDERDKKALSFAIPDYEKAKPLPKYYFNYFKVGEPRFYTVQPVKLDKITSIKPEDRTLLDNPVPKGGKELHWL